MSCRTCVLILNSSCTVMVAASGVALSVSTISPASVGNTFWTALGSHILLRILDCFIPIACAASSSPLGTPSNAPLMTSPTYPATDIMNANTAYGNAALRVSQKKVSLIPSICGNTEPSPKYMSHSWISRGVPRTVVQNIFAATASVLGPLTCASPIGIASKNPTDEHITSSFIVIHTPDTSLGAYSVSHDQSIYATPCLPFLYFFSTALNTWLEIIVSVRYIIPAAV